MTDHSNERPIIETHAAYDYETFKAHHLAVKRVAAWVTSGIWLTIAAGCFAVWFVYDRDIYWLGMCGLFLLLAAFYLLGMIVLPLKNIEKSLRRLDLGQSYNTFRFYSDRVELEGRDEHSQSASTLEYSYYASAGEGRAFFSLTARDGDTCLFSKNDLADFEQMEALRTLFKEKFGKKFKKMR